MKSKQLFPLILLASSFLANAQGDLIMDDRSNSGLVSIDAIADERYNVNDVEEFPLIEINLNQILGDNLLLGETYSFPIEIINRIGADKGWEIAIKDVNAQCHCIKPTWSSGSIPPGGSKGIGFTLKAGARGTFNSLISVSLSDPAGLKPVARQRIKIIFEIR